MSAFPQNIPLCFLPPPCFIAAGHFPTLSGRDQRTRIDIHPSLSFMKAKSFTSRKERRHFFPIQFAPIALPHPRLSSLLSQEEEMDVRECAFLKLDAWKHLLLRKLNSRWASVCVCVCWGKRTFRTWQAQVCDSLYLLHNENWFYKQSEDILAKGTILMSLHKHKELFEG